MHNRVVSHDSGWCVGVIVCSRLRVLFYILISECFFSWDFLQSSSQIVNLRKHQVHRIFDFSRILVGACEDCV